MAHKYLPLLYILLLCFTTVAGIVTPKTESSAEETQVIPDEAIRLRILANSNKEEDQDLKRKIRDAVNKEINQWVAELTSVEEARKVISSNLGEIESIAKEVMEKEGNIQNLKVEFGKTVFPTKLYGQYLYPAGEYEAIRITLGSGEGENWWCVLFPPLCFLDFSSGTAVKDSDKGEKKEEIKRDTENKKEHKKPENKKDQADSKRIDKQTAEAPIYEDRDEESPKVKFFLAELFDSLF